MQTRPLKIWILFGVVNAAGFSGLEAQPMQLTSARLLASQELAVSFTAPTGHTYRLETTTNLSEWSALFTFPTNTQPTLQHTDSAAPFLDTRYYRAAQVSGTNLVSGDHLATTNGDVIIQPRNHATFVMQWNGKMIYVDPVAAATYTGLPKADLILITHGHSDHLSTATIEAIRGPGCTLVAPQSVYASLTSAQKALTTVLANDAPTTALGLTIRAVPAYNSNHARGAGNGYVLEIGGRRIYISGDTGDQPEIRALTAIDVAFVCINQPYTMTVNAATNCVRAMRPNVVYPYHYRDQNGITTNAATFKQWLGTELGIEVRLRDWY